MNALKNSFKEEKQNCHILQNQSHIFWDSTKPDPYFNHDIARLSHTLYSTKNNNRRYLFEELRL